MASIMWHDTRRYSLTSWGNGTALELMEKASSRTIHFQGDDARALLDGLKVLTEGRPCLTYDDALGCLWYNYASDPLMFGV